MAVDGRQARVRCLLRRARMQTLVRRGVYFERFAHELLKGSGLEEHHRRIVTTKIDRSPVIAPERQIHGPEVPASIMRDWVPVR